MNQSGAHAVFPSCPMCLSTTYEVTPIKGRVFLHGYSIRCTRCRTLWRIGEQFGVTRVTLVEEGSNPRNLELSDVIGQEKGNDYWRRIRQPVFRCRLCDAQGHVTTVPFRIGGTRGLEMFFFPHMSQWGENLMKFEMHVCPRCRYVEFYAAEAETSK